MNRIQRRLQKIERTIDPILDSVLGGIGDRIRPTVERFDISLEKTVMWCFAKFDGLNKRCPRCKVRWSPIIGDRYRVSRYKCAGCQLVYEPENALVAYYKGNSNITVRWDLVDHKCVVEEGSRTHNVVWLPYDFESGDINKYLVLV